MFIFSAQTIFLYVFPVPFKREKGFAQYFLLSVILFHTEIIWNPAEPPPQRATVLPMHPHSLPSSSLLRKVRSVSVRPGRGARRPVEQKGRLPGEAAAAGKATAPTATPCRWRQGACACACVRVCACVCMCCACALCACVHTCAHACARVCPSGFSGEPWPIKPFSVTSQGGGARA